ncbi:MAG: alpha-1,4-glucan--maltose-1-phosphate maltosyltransferase [Spirochaetota bacterium]
MSKDCWENKRVVIENLSPEIEEGEFAAKRVKGENVRATADIFADGHDAISALLLYRYGSNSRWQSTPMRHLVNDRWEGVFQVKKQGIYYYTVTGWIDHFRTWQNDLKKKWEAGQEVGVELLMGVEYLEEALKKAAGEHIERIKNWISVIQKKQTRESVALMLDSEPAVMMDRYSERKTPARYKRELAVEVSREKALFSTWYEIFPRSCAQNPGEHGSLKDCEKLLGKIAEMGFDVIYLPPIHPIGKTNRKGKNNSTEPDPDDPGSPWAIGSEEGGHKTVHPQLGTIEDLENLVKAAGKQGMEVAIDLAYQCSPDHPYVKEHPDWFKWRPDGRVQFAENPPKKYEDVLPLNFDTDDRQSLWEELKSIILFWIDKGISIFRVDNPHTKPFVFWEWVLKEIKKDHPDVLFLSEAFTRPKVMNRLAKVGFDQSYTYFTWRNTKHELTHYLTELTTGGESEYFRPNFWPNTPDILPEYLQFGGRPAFIIRLVLAATLSSNYGIYGPAYELCVNEAVPGKEEYLNSEKYEIKHWDRNAGGSIKQIIARVNTIRKQNPALQETRNVCFYHIDNDLLLFYEKLTPDLSNIILVGVNLDPFHTQSGWVHIPLKRLNLEEDRPFLVEDLISTDKYIWRGEHNYVELNPHVLPVHIFKVRRYLHRESDFDYFM